VLQLLGGVLLQFPGNGHVLRALEDLGVHDIGDDRLVLAGQVFVEVRNQLLTREQRGAGPAAVALGRASGSGVGPRAIVFSCEGNAGEPRLVRANTMPALGERATARAGARR
jgi:hypothetical protein